MEEKSLVVVEQPQNVQAESVLFIEQFINDNYRLRRNVLSGKVEFKMREDVTADYRPLTQEAQNSMVIRALREGLDEVCNPKADITMYVNSEEVRKAVERLHSCADCCLVSFASTIWIT